MNVLITGGYGFIGLYTAERLIKEGHRVFILDNRDINVPMANFKHKYIKMDVNDEKCVEIFRINSFDLVVHLAAQPDIEISFENPYGDNLTNVCGLVNMLSLAYKYGVGRFIFISSASVYGEGINLPFSESSPVKPISPHASGKLAGEEYCRIFHELYGLNTVSLRVSNVYGFKPWIDDRADVTGELIKCALSGFNLRISGNGTQTRDFIYVEDVADAIFRCIESDYCGVMNLSSNTETSINDLVKILQKTVKAQSITYYQSGKCDVSRSWLDNTRAKRELDWAPMYTLEEGVKKTFERYLKEYGIRSRNVKKKKAGQDNNGKAAGLLKTILPYLENLLMFTAVFLIESFSPSMGELDFIDLKLVYIILIGVVYGTRHSIIAVGLSAGLLIYGGNKGLDLITVFYDSSSLMRIAFYLFIGFFVGYSIDIKNRSVKDHINKYNSIQSKMDFLNGVYNETRQVKEELQKQIRMSEDSLTKVYGIIRELDAVNPEKIYSSAVNVIERIMKTGSIAIYVLSGNGYFARLAACSGSISGRMKKSLRIDQYPELNAVLETRGIFINRKLDPDMPVMAMPVENNGTVIALLEIYDMEFESINLYYQNLFKIVSNFISSSLTNAARYQDAVFKDKYIEGTRILKREKFDEILQIRVQASQRNLSGFIVIKVPASDSTYQELDFRLANMVRDTDYMGEGADGMLHILLSNTDRREGEHVLKRLSDAGITAFFDTGDDISA